ncbi:calreticulin 3 [Rhizoclosmatium hyalinum]|nr:calreticulin 3 [Rhizoclosmatium hyalinum]
MDGEWEAPKISNPEFKGEWKAKQIPNPEYKGPWVHPEIDNPEYKEDAEIYHYTNAHVGFDLWQVKSGTIFDNIIVTDSIAEAEKFGKKTWADLKEKEQSAKDKLDEKERKEAEEKAEKEKKEREAEEAASKKDEKVADDAEEIEHEEL